MRLTLAATIACLSATAAFARAISDHSPPSRDDAFKQLPRHLPGIDFLDIAYIKSIVVNTTGPAESTTLGELEVVLFNPRIDVRSSGLIGNYADEIPSRE